MLGGLDHNPEHPWSVAEPAEECGASKPSAAAPLARWPEPDDQGAASAAWAAATRAIGTLNGEQLT